ncbi:unnamed protein product [Phytomonas sp. Hart1]|nr:unnamed protein product [Phytomonas sp. Hart1]|eukprot:CCW67150.1 unnamed protein product [Phytomonas sp. isolate Hart1]
MQPVDAKAATPPTDPRPTLPLTASRGDSQEADREAPGGALVERPLRLTWRLFEASPTLPAMVRLQEIERPVTRWVCGRCRGQRAEPVDPFPSACPHCGEIAQTRESFYVVLHLSDTIDWACAVGHTAVGESLFGMSESSFIAQKQNNEGFMKAACDGLVGAPIAVWLLVAPNEKLILVGCRPINLNFSSTVLLSAIHTLLEG